MAQARKISQTFNGLNRWIIGGAYFKLLSTVNSVDVKLYIAGQVVVDASQVDQGFYSREAFDRIEITTGANELVAFIVADKEAGSDQFTGSVNSTLVGPFVADNADAQAPVGAGGILPTLSRLEGWDGAAFNRIAAIGDGDAQASGKIALIALAREMGWNGAAFDRVRVDHDGASLGSLRVQRYADAIVRAGSCFGYPGLQAAIAGQFSAVELFNAAGSGVVVYVDQIEVQPAAAAATVQLGFNNAAFATDIGNGTNMNGGGAAGVARLSKQGFAAIPGVPFAQYLVKTTDQVSIRLDPCIRLSEGQALVLYGGVVNQQLQCSWRWREYAI